jgi:hypothetical protein
MFTTLDAAAIDQFSPTKDKPGEARRFAANLFDRAYAVGKRQRLWARLIGKTSQLPGLSHQDKVSRRTLNTVVVPLSKIVGTEGRSADFDADFHPLNQNSRERWISIAAAQRMGSVLPAVELVQVGDEYFVRDGHHRISVARAFGQEEIDARLIN